MIIKNSEKQLFAIFKNQTHKGNAYGFDKLDAVKTHLKMCDFPIHDEIINEYKVIEAKENIHFFKSASIIMP